MNNIVIFNWIIKDWKEPENQNDVKNIFEKYIERSKNDRENFITDLLNNFNEVSDIFWCININEDILLKFINWNNEEINWEEKLAVEKFLQFSIKFLEIKITKINHINNILNLNKNELNDEDLVLLSNFLKNKNLDWKIKNIEITLKSKNEKSSEKLTLKEIIEWKDIFWISEHIKTFIDKLLKNEVYFEKNEEIENLNEMKLIYNFSENNEKNNEFNEDKLEEDKLEKKEEENEFVFQLEVDNKNKLLDLIFNLPQEKKISFFDLLYEIIKLEWLDAQKSKIPALAYYLWWENSNNVYQVLVKLYKNNGYN